MSVTTSVTLIDRSNEVIYVAGDGSNEFVGTSRNYGYELTNWQGWSGSVRHRSINRCRLNGEEDSEGARVPGHPVVDFSVARRHARLSGAIVAGLTFRLSNKEN